MAYFLKKSFQNLFQIANVQMYDLLHGLIVRFVENEPLQFVECVISRMCDFANVRFRECAISRMCDFANVRFRERVLPHYKFRCLLSKDLLSVYCFDCNGFIDQVRMEGSVIVA